MSSYFLGQRDYLLAISRAMTSNLDLPSVLNLILEGAAELVGARVALVAVKEADGKFHFAAQFGVPDGMLRLFTPFLENIPVTRGRTQLSGWQIPDLYVRLARVSTAVRIPLTQVIALPLVLNEEIIGVLYMFRITGIAFSSNDQQVLSSFANQAAIAIRNARLYQEVLTEKSRLDAIIENSAEGIMILDPDCRIQVFNRALARMTGWRSAEAIGKYCAEALKLRGAQDVMLCGEHCPLVEAYGQASAGAPTQHYTEGDIERPDGSRIAVGVSHSLLYDEHGRLVNIIVNVHDISRFREAEEMKSTFISVISHELKTPVTLIKGYASTLRREDAQWDEKTVRESLSIIEQESDRLDRLINDLLDASRIEAGGLKLEPADLSLSRLIPKTVEKFRTQTETHRFEMQVPPDLPLVYADEQRISQVLYNLISNAIKYSPRGGVIRVGAEARPNDILVWVADEGIGIPPDEQERLFERFYRVDSSLRRRTQGAGLGLYICRSIVEAHGGRIWLADTDRGTRVRVRLPAAA